MYVFKSLLELCVLTLVRLQTKEFLVNRSALELNYDLTVNYIILKLPARLLIVLGQDRKLLKRCIGLCVTSVFFHL